MDLKEFYKEFEEEVKKRISADLWEKSVAKGDPEGFAKELAAAEFTPEEAAEEYEEMIKQMEKEGFFSECNAKPWTVKYKDIWDKEAAESFDDDKEAWARYNELSARTCGDMSDILWVEEPKGPASECGSAASLGAVPNGGSRVKNESVSNKDVEAFLRGALDHAVLGDDDTVYVKFVAKDGPDGSVFELRALMPGGEDKLLKSGGLFAVTDYFRELLDMPMENAITLIEGA